MTRDRLVDRTCETCGSTFAARAYAVKTGGGKFCSRSCAAKKRAASPDWILHDRRGRVTGERNGNWKGGVALTKALKHKNYRIRNPLKVNARLRCQRAVRSGRLIKQPCSVCGSDQNVHGHHTDYNKALDVIWMCQTCHQRQHGAKK